MVLRHSLAFLYLWCKSHIDLLNNLLGAIICEMGIDIQGDLCTFMPSKVLDGFDIYAPEQQVCDVCVAKDIPKRWSSNYKGIDDLLLSFIERRRITDSIFGRL